MQWFQQIGRSLSSELTWWANATQKDQEKCVWSGWNRDAFYAAGCAFFGFGTSMDFLDLPPSQDPKVPRSQGPSRELGGWATSIAMTWISGDVLVVRSAQLVFLSLPLSLETPGNTRVHHAQNPAHSCFVESSWRQPLGLFVTSFWSGSVQKKAKGHTHGQHHPRCLDLPLDTTWKQAGLVLPEFSIVRLDDPTTRYFSTTHREKIPCPWLATQFHWFPEKYIDSPDSTAMTVHINSLPLLEGPGNDIQLAPQRWLWNCYEIWVFFSRRTSQKHQKPKKTDIECIQTVSGTCFFNVFNLDVLVGIPFFGQNELDSWEPPE